MHFIFISILLKKFTGVTTPAHSKLFFSSPSSIPPSVQDLSSAQPPNFSAPFSRPNLSRAFLIYFLFILTPSPLQPMFLPRPTPPLFPSPLSQAHLPSAPSSTNPYTNFSNYGITPPQNQTPLSIPFLQVFVLLAAPTHTLLHPRPSLHRLRRSPSSMEFSEDDFTDLNSFASHPPSYPPNRPHPSTRPHPPLKIRNALKSAIFFFFTKTVILKSLKKLGELGKLSRSLASLRKL